MSPERNFEWFPFVPIPGDKPKIPACAVTRNGTGNALLCRMMPNQLNRTEQGSFCSLNGLERYFQCNIKGLLD